MSVARDGKLAGFVVGIAVIFAYYVVFLLAESLTKGYYADPAAVKAGGRFMAAHLARWVPNIVMGLFGLGALIWRARYTEGATPRPGARDASAAGSSCGGEAGSPARRPDTSRSSRAPRRPIVVIRIPHLTCRCRGSSIATSAASTSASSVLSFLALLGLFYISTFIDSSEKIFKGQATTGMVMALLVYMTPQFVYYIIPIATLLSVLVTFGVLSRSSELTVMKACGVSLYRARAAVVLLSLVFSGILFALEQQVMAQANRHAEALDAQIRNRPPRLMDV